MSTLPVSEPMCTDGRTRAVELVIDARPRDVDGLPVRRLLPSPRRRLVGPFIFFDHMGPAQLDPGRGIDVRPHPHIALATLTYLFEGEIVHRDTLGSHQPIRPGDVNWMFAGRGIAHSERSSPDHRQMGARVHGIQSWVAVPTEVEEAEPRFDHHPSLSIPRLTRAGAELRVVAGSAYGETSPVPVLSKTLYVDALLEPGAELDLPNEHEERAAYVVEGSVGVGDEQVEAGAMLVLRPGIETMLRATKPSRVMLLGGAPLDGERHIWWNFVSSSKDRIEQAKRDWSDDRFGTIPGDEDERIPLPTA